MIWVLDIDGVITANPEFFRWWTYQLRKSGQKVYILTSRNPIRVSETEEELKKWDIVYDGAIFMPDSFSRDFTSQAQWKVDEIRKLKPNFWIDNNLKIYRRALGVDTYVEGVVEMEL